MESRNKLQTLPFELMTMVCGYMAPEDIKRVLFLDQYFCQTVVEDKHNLWESKFSIHFPLAYQKLQNEKKIDWKSEFWKQHNIECRFIEKSLGGNFSHEGSTISQLAEDIMRLFSYAKEGHYSKFNELWTALKSQVFPLHEGLGTLFSLLKLKNTSNESLLDCIQENDSSNLMLNHIYAFVQSFHYDNRELLFIWACRCRQPDSVFKEFLKQGPDYFTATECDIAAKEGCSAVIRLAFERGPIDPDVQFSRDAHANLSRKLFLAAAERGQTHILKLILKLDPSFNVNANANAALRRTALHAAASMGQVQAIKFLLKKKANVNAAEHNGDTPLHCAVNHSHIVKLLLENNANINAKNYQGMTLLHYAVQSLHYSEALLPVLLNHEDEKNKLQIDAIDNDGCTALDIAVQDNFLATKLLLEKSANPNRVAADGTTPLFFAGTQEIAKLLLAHGAQVNVINSNNRTSLDFAIDRRNPAIVDLLVKNNAQVTDAVITQALGIGDEKIIKSIIPFATDMTFSDAKQNNLLHLAIQFDCDSEVIKDLVGKGCDKNAVNSEGVTPLALLFQLSKEKPKFSELREIETISGESDEEDTSGYESEDEFTVEAIEARLKKLQPSDSENIEISNILLLDAVREQYDDADAKELKAEPKGYVIIMHQVNFDDEIVIQPIDTNERIADNEMNHNNLDFDPIEGTGNELLSLEFQLSEEFLENETVVIDPDETNKNAIAKNVVEKFLAIAKLCFSKKENQDFFIDRVQTILQAANQEQEPEAICEKAYADTAKYLIYKTANKLPDEKQEDLIKLAKELSEKYKTREAEQIKGSFEQEVLARAKVEIELVTDEKARLVRVLRNEYTRIQGDFGKFLNDKVKTQNKLNLIARSINKLKMENEPGSLITFASLENFKTTLLKSKTFTSSRNRFFTIESDAKKHFEEKFGKLGTSYKKK